jgi:excisionase family DNA binding protein
LAKLGQTSPTQCGGVDQSCEKAGHCERLRDGRNWLRLEDAQLSKNAENHWRLVYSIQEATHACGLSRATIYRLIASGQLKTVKVGGRRLVRPEAIEELLNAGAGK